MTYLPDFKLETYFSKWEFTARYNLCASDAESISLTELLALAEPEDRAAWDQLHLCYTETFGLPALRATIAATYEGLAPEDILCFCGAEEGIFAAMHALLSAEDHAVVVTPNYQSAETLPLSICAVTGVALDPEDGWSLDVSALEAALRPNTRVISINFPHNPTGKVIPRESFDAVVELARDRGIALFSDEVYRLLEHDESKRLPQAAEVYDRGLSLGVMSKAYGLPGLRIGWIACRDRALLSRMERIKHYLSICNPAPSELLALIALKARDRILARNRQLIAANLAALEAFFAERPELFDWATPDAGCIAFPRYKGPEGVEAFAADLVAETGVLLLPASNYRSELGPVPTDRFRVGYGRADFQEGLAAFRAHLTRNVG